MKNIRLRFLQVILIIFVITLVGCSDKKNVENLQRGNSNKETNEVEEEKPQEEKPQENGEDQLGFADENQEEDQTETYEYINQAGNILEERINTPPDFNRIDVPHGSLAEF